MRTTKSNMKNFIQFKQLTYISTMEQYSKQFDCAQIIIDLILKITLNFKEILQIQ